MFDIAIIGAGPGGYIAAIRASQLGASVVLIEKDNYGGTCLNRGCIPSKTFLNVADKMNDLNKLAKLGINLSEYSLDFSKVAKRKDITVLKLQKGVESLLKSYNVNLIKGEASLEKDGSLVVNGEKIEYKNLIIASGSEPQSLPGISLDGEFILSSNDILKLNELPKSVLIVGSGAIGLEWARIFNSFKVETTLTELAPNLLPTADFSISEYIEKSFKQQKIKFFTNTKIEKIEDKFISLSNSETLSPDIVLVAVGRKPDLSFINAEIHAERGFLSVNNNFQTNADNIYAIGDVTGKLQLAHCASHQAVAAVEHILEGKEATIDYTLVPSVIYGKPEIASIGLREQDIQDKSYKKSLFPLNILGKSVADDESEGFIKVLSINDKIVGAHIVSKEASALIHNFSLPIKEGYPVKKLEHLVFAHPTYAEGIHEAILGLNDKALHLPKGVLL